MKVCITDKQGRKLSEYTLTEYVAGVRNAGYEDDDDGYVETAIKVMTDDVSAAMHLAAHRELQEID